jgi:hypothetical protein
MAAVVSRECAPSSTRHQRRSTGGLIMPCICISASEFCYLSTHQVKLICSTHLLKRILVWLMYKFPQNQSINHADQQIYSLLSRIHPRRCICFIEEEAKTADTTLKGYLIQTQCTVHTTTHTDQTTQTHLVPSTAKNGEETIHRGF